MKHIHQFIQGIKNLIRWFPIVWKDRDFDYRYLYNILHKKLEHMEQFFESNYAMSMDANKYAKQIMVAKNLAKRLAEESHLENAMLFYDQKYEVYNPFENTIPHEKLEGFQRLLPDPDKDRSKAFDKCCKHSSYMKKQDQEYLFNYLNKHINAWWD